jgi:hypothetical protein
MPASISIFTAWATNDATTRQDVIADSFDVVTIRSDYSGDLRYWVQTTGGYNQVVYAGGVVAGRTNVGGLSYNGTTITGIHNGTISTTAHAGTLASTTPRPHVGIHSGLVDNKLNGIVYFAFWWSRALSAQELLTLYADPYCFLRPLVRRSYVFFRTTAGTRPLPHRLFGGPFVGPFKGGFAC